MTMINPDADRLAKLSSTVDDTFRKLLEGYTDAAMLDFPDHPNVGDSAIYCGEMEAIARVWSGKLPYIASFSSYDRGTLHAVAPDGLLMIHGGGNIGEIYPHHHSFRLRMLREWVGRPLVQLPQTLHFASEDADDDFARAIERHGQFHLIVRDSRSYEHAKRRYQCNVTLAPDSAFALGSLGSSVQPSVRVIALCRTDAERRQGNGDVVSVGEDVHVADWPEEGGATLYSLVHLIGRFGTFGSRSGARRTIAMANWSFHRRAWQRLQRGIDLLSLGEIVATDRLHAYILAMLIGKRYFVADNSYGKLSAVHNTWLVGTQLGTWADSLDQAIRQARARN
jgi:pyruvyl transferase EpsO